LRDEHIGGSPRVEMSMSLVGLVPVHPQLNKIENTILESEVVEGRIEFGTSNFDFSWRWEFGYTKEDTANNQ